MAKREPSPIGSGLCNSARLTRLFHFVSLRRSATRSKTSSGGRAIRVVVVTRTARSYPGAKQPFGPRCPRSSDEVSVVCQSLPRTGPGEMRPEQAAERSDEMTRYLISFPSGAMDHIPEEEMPAVGDAAHAV